MRDFRTRLAPFLGPLLALIVVWPLIAHAAARVVAPESWWQSSAAAPEAQRRAGRWKDALGLRLVQVVSAPDDDRFAETVAVFERAQPVPAQAFASEEQAVEALSSAVANVVGARAPESGGLRNTDAGQQVAWGRWIIDDLAYECVLAPSAESATLVVTAVLAAELDEQREILDQLVATLEGVSEPMPRFSLLSWRIGAVLVWMALGLALHAAMLNLADRENDHGTAGRRAALINLGLVAVGTLVARVALGGRELALVYAGSSIAGLSVWIAVTGIVVVGVHFLLASRLDRGVVQSAPSSGAFASGTYSITTSGVRPRISELSESSGSWTRPKPAGPRAQDPSSSGRIIIDESERE